MSDPCYLEHRSAPGEAVRLLGRPLVARQPAIIHALLERHVGYGRDETARRGFRVRRGQPARPPGPHSPMQKPTWASPFDDVPRGHNALNDAILHTVCVLLERGDQPTEKELAGRFGFSEKQAKRYLKAAAERLEAA